MSGVLLRFSPFALATLLLTVFFHILIVLVLPQSAMRTAGHILSAKVTTAGVTILPPARPGAEPHPFADPAFIMGLCAFDLAEGPYQVRVPLGDTFFSLVVLSESGAVIHALSDKAATRRLMDVALVTPQQQRALEAQDPEDEPVQEIRLRLAMARGTIALKMLAPRPADMETARDLLGRAQCRPISE